MSWSPDSQLLAVTIRAPVSVSNLIPDVALSTSPLAAVCRESSRHSSPVGNERSLVHADVCRNGMDLLGTAAVSRSGNGPIGTGT